MEVDFDNSSTAVKIDGERDRREALRLLANVIRRSSSSQAFASLPVQMANALMELSGYLWIRGESYLEHYYAESIALGCVRPAATDIRRYEALLLSFIRFDRRRPMLPEADAFLPLMLNDQQCIHFIQLVRSQASFQPLYEAALQFDTYGAMARPRRKLERIVLFARELTARTLLGPPTPEEEIYLRLGS
ncbi:MAG TPA: hypothetical protein VGJ82_14070 [Thermoanaerobaculia bacterium]